ncbi:hypothetical protein RHMOL_Rhmol05G0130600 [Rhododendron molle]|uniref:Uncharacterized protein n=1 Tax=Rhododendron molle TaxID=49168 RepID=A0ACC0NNC1_RHOML|nr:hypothetical protein RHMOL_Rhmol05G0130600 [Rhododendron molle]
MGQPSFQTENVSADEGDPKSYDSETRWTGLSTNHHKDSHAHCVDKKDIIEENVPEVGQKRQVQERIYFFDANLTPRKLDHPPFDHMSGSRTIQDFHYGLVELLRGVCCNEPLHWLCERIVGSDYSKVVVAFDLADEIVRGVQLPASYDDNESMGHDMVVLEGCLCLLFLLGTTTSSPSSLLIMEDGFRNVKLFR